ncbi:5-carboxymethyl-2-hydroxymuconate Delta-isomerase [Gemmatimonadota bacterium]
MPHLTLEYTSNLADRKPTPQLMLGIHRHLESSAGIKIGNCKTRWREVGEWVVGDGAGPSAFVHLDVRFLEGRTEEVRRAVGAGALELLKTHFLPAPEGVDLQITVEIQEIREGVYFKDPSGTLSGPPPAWNA